MQHSIALLLLLAAAGGAHAWGTEISPTVALFRTVEYDNVEYLTGKEATRCEHMVDNAAKTGSRRIQFLITHYFVDRSNDLVPDSYCYKPYGDTARMKTCIPFTDEYIASWSASFTQCLKYAVDLGFTGIALTPHLDDGLEMGQWRNAMMINPLAKYGGYSYTDILLQPMASVMASVMNKNLTVWFAMQGEMSKMVTKYPAEHQKLLAYLKHVITGGNSELAPNVHMGVSTNYNKLCGQLECNPGEVMNPALYNAAAVKSLYDALDFIGMSAYPGFNGQDLTGMESASFSLDYELKMFGVNLAQLVNVQGKELIYNEFGVGGGASNMGDTPATTLNQAANMPYYGVFGPYTRKLDPWKSALPSTVASVTRQYLQDWYRAASLWLSRKGGPTLRVDAVFMWNLNSWDVIGIHPQSTNKEGSYRNEVVAATIRAHNLACRGVSSIYNPGSYAPY